jgi:hypothetical protein
MTNISKHPVSYYGMWFLEHLLSLGRTRQEAVGVSDNLQFDIVHRQV